MSNFIVHSYFSTEHICCICREGCVNPVKLPCKHIFCFLCLKGVAARNNQCALCREPIPFGFLNKMVVLSKDEITTLTNSCSTWFYEAKNGGWWMYERRVAEEIEKAFNDKKEQIRVQISGFPYTIDLVSMVQYRDDKPNRKRKIQRGGVSDDSVKGVAGILIKDSVTEKEVT